MSDHELDDDRHRLVAGPLSASVQAVGAELTSFHHAEAGEFLWTASSPWPRHSPVLFPIVGRLNGDHLHHEDRSYPMAQHGFARDRRFTWTERSEAACALVLEDDAESRAVFPFRFRLELAYRLTEEGLTMSYRLGNPGEAPLLASLGAHPGFRWPLADGVPEDQHRIVFAEEEPEPLRRVEADGLLGDPKPSPVRGRDLPLDRTLFADGALVFDRPISRSLRYEAPGAPTLQVAWEGFDELGLWAREGGAFLCIEPWRGEADPVGFHGQFADKPGVMRIEPGEAETMQWSVTIALA